MSSFACTVCTILFKSWWSLQIAIESRMALSMSLFTFDRFIYFVNYKLKARYARKKKRREEVCLINKWKKYKGRFWAQHEVELPINSFTYAITINSSWTVNTGGNPEKMSTRVKEWQKCIKSNSLRIEFCTKN